MTNSILKNLSSGETRRKGAKISKADRASIVQCSISTYKKEKGGRD